MFKPLTELNYYNSDALQLPILILFNINCRGLDKIVQFFIYLFFLDFYIKFLITEHVFPVWTASFPYNRYFSVKKTNINVKYYCLCC